MGGGEDDKEQERENVRLVEMDVEGEVKDVEDVTNLAFFWVTLFTKVLKEWTSRLKHSDSIV